MPRCVVDTLRSAQVHDAESVTVRVSQHHEVRVGRVHVPIQPGGAESDQSIDGRYLLGGIVDEEIGVDAWVGVSG